MKNNVTDPFAEIADRAHFNIYHSDLWKGTARRFAEMIVYDCIDILKPTEHHEAWAQSYIGGVDGLELLEAKINAIKEHFEIK